MQRKKWMQLLYFGLFAGGAVAADQITKALTVANIACHSKDVCNTATTRNIPFIDGVLSFTHSHNTGAAWSMMEGARWLFVALFVAMTALVLWEYIKKPMGFNQFERWCIAAVWAGGLGNVIDRVRLGYVIDMIQTEFMSFPIFNVADCFITCGCIGLIVSLIFFNKKFWKEDKK